MKLPFTLVSLLLNLQSLTLNIIDCCNPFTIRLETQVSYGFILNLFPFGIL